MWQKVTRDIRPRDSASCGDTRLQNQTASYSLASCVFYWLTRRISIAFFRSDLLPASIVRDDYFDLFVRGIAAAVGARDRGRIDPSIAITLSLGSK